MKLKLRSLQLQTFIKLLAGWLVAKLTRRPNTDLWLFCERGTDARDNGYWMFRFIKESHPEINAKYLISQKSEDKKKLAQWKEDIVDYDSWKHFFLLFQAKHLISTHAFGYLPNSIRTTTFFRNIFKKLSFAKTTWLAHGIKKDACKGYYSANIQNDLFICGASPEYEFIKNNFGHPEGVVQYTGLARFDQLHSIDVDKHQLLLMPTWRLWFNDEDFIGSQYLKTYTQLLTDKRLHRILKEKDLRLVFYPHYEIQPYLSEFTKLDLPENIVIADKEHYEVQQLLKESALLITDYSSVFFDFAYMKKPILYFQFDEKKFREGHYAEGYFDYHDGLGQWTDNIDDLLEPIKKLADEGFKMPEQYLEKVNEFFPLHDTHNCERIFNAINQL